MHSRVAKGWRVYPWESLPDSESTQIQPSEQQHVLSPAAQHSHSKCNALCWNAVWKLLFFQRVLASVHDFANVTWQYTNIDTTHTTSVA